MLAKCVPLHWTILAATLLGPFFAPSRGGATEAIQLRRGFSQIFKLDQPAQLVSVGDPTIADVTLGTGSTILVLTGKKIGTTNVTVLGQDGLEIYDATLEVGPNDERNRIKIRYPAGNKNKDPGSPAFRTFVCDPNCEEELSPAGVSPAGPPATNDQ
jgi:Flp pilus assembly secretin CpaC